MTNALPRLSMSQEADEVLGSPLRTLAATLLFVCTVFLTATVGYTFAG